MMAQEAPAPRHGVLRLLRVERTVADLPRALAFYRSALGFATAADLDAHPQAQVHAGSQALGGAPARADARSAGAAEARLLAAGPLKAASVTLGDQELRLMAFDAPGRAYPCTGSAADLWFQHIAVVASDIEAAWRRLQDHGACAITRGGPQRLPASAGGVSAFKFRDPEGHPVELIHFPVGTGAPIWQQRTLWGLTLGIDHSAISVADPERSIAFYAGILGLGVAARQVNRGVEQERLDDLPDVEVDVVALQPALAATPHIELLGYRRPRPRAAPTAATANDLAADRLVFEVADLQELLARIEHAGIGAASGACTSFPDGSCAALVRDPDRHLLVLQEAAGHLSDGPGSGSTPMR
jgi:catechol 2,3-dioxygenase-like lactoylglutathione lyase family enzyme